MYDFVAIGDATLDVFMQIDEASVLCGLDNASCKLCLSYADKVAVNQVDFIIGGNAANAAVGARRLGLSSAFLSTIGDDDTGNKIQSVFHKEGVSTEHLTVNKGAASNYSVVLNFQAERTILVHHVPREYQWNIHQAPKWFYVTSMGEGFEAIYDQVIAMMRQGNVFMAYNPGTHQLKKGLEFLKQSLSVTTILFLNRQEAAGLLSVPDQSSIVPMLQKLHALGPKMVVITDGPKGAYVFDGKTMYQMGIFDGPVLERTGCGDSFGTAFTVAIAEGKSIQEAMQWGAANATSVVTKVGPQAGLLNQGEIIKSIQANANTKPLVLLDDHAVHPAAI